MEDINTTPTHSNGTPDTNLMPASTDAMMTSSDSMGIKQILFLKCDADQKRQEGMEFVDRLFRCVTLLVPIEESIHEVIDLQGPYTIGKSPAMAKNTKKSSNISKKQASEESVERHLEPLKGIQKRIKESSDTDIDQVLRDLYFIGSQVNINISRIRHMFRSIAYTSGFCEQITKNMVSKIGYEDYRDEAGMYYSTIVAAASELDLPRWTQTEFRVWCDEALRGLSLMKEIAQQRIKVEKLVMDDRKRKTRIIVGISAYIAVFITVFVAIGLFFGGYIQMASLKSTMLPLIWVPWPVIVWSLIGSFAAVLHRLNKQPIYAFDSTFRWLVIRPVQGIILGAAMYLIVAAGIFLLNGSTISSTETTDQTLTTAEVVILVLCFLIGFSDRFADNVLNTVVRHYTTSKDSANEAQDNP